MNIPLFISSTNSDVGSVSHDFSISFDPEIVLDKNTNYYIALDSLDMSYSWHNISDKFQNNTFKYSHDNGKTWRNVVLNRGNYSYEDLSCIIQQISKSNGHSATGITISFIRARLLVFLTLETNFQIDLNNTEFGDLIGFSKAIITSSSYGIKIPNITRSDDEIVIHSNIISKSIVNGKSSNILYKFGINNLAISLPFHKEGRRELYNINSVSTIKELGIYITDSLNRPIDLNGQAVELVLLLKAV